MTKTLLQTSIVGAGGVASIEFTNIPQNGTDLLLVTSTRQNTSGVNIAFIKFNGSSSGFSVRWIEGTGSSANSSNNSLNYAALVQGSSSTSNTFTSSSIYIANYTSSQSKVYSVDTVTENNATSAFQHMQAGQWTNSAAISSILIEPDGDTFDQHTTAYLYMIN